jgi:hypothetical protein
MFSRPFGTYALPVLPGVETPGYFRLSRWDNGSANFKNIEQ